MSECQTVFVAQWLNAGFSRERPRFDIMAGRPVKVLEVTGKQVLPWSLHVQMARISFFLWLLRFFKDYKPEVPSHNSFESQLCGTLKNPHAIRKEKARSSRCCGLFFTQVKNVKVFFFSFKKGNGNSQGLIRLSNNLYRKRFTKTKQIMITSLNRRICVYTFCLINICLSLSDDANKIKTLNIERE